MHSADRLALEDALAALLLQGASGQVLVSDAVDAIERTSKQLFFVCHRLEEYVPSPALLEGLLRLASIDQTFSSRLLSCVLLLSLSSRDAWMATCTCNVFQKYSQLSELVALAAAARNPSWQSWSKEDQEEVSTACVEISRVDGSLDISDVARLRLSPLAMALQECVVRTSAESTTYFQRDEANVRSLFHRIPPSGWDVVPDEDFPTILSRALQAGLTVDQFSERLSSGFPKRSPATDRVYKVCVRHGASSIATDWRKRFRVDMCEPAKEAFSSSNASMLLTGDISTAKEAYDLANACQDAGDLAKIQSTVSVWLREGKKDLAAAAYAALPKELSKIVGGKADLCETIQNLPHILHSPVDTIVDRALSEFLRSLREFASVMPRHGGQEIDGQAYTRLKKAALIHPFLVLRRSMCFCAAGVTILESLTEPAVRYEKKSLKVIEGVFSIILSLPGSLPEEVEDLSMSALHFVLEENRVTNGIPELFTPIAVQVMKAIGRCSKVRHEAELLDLIPKVIQSNQKNSRVKEAAQDLRLLLLRS